MALTAIATATAAALEAQALLKAGADIYTGGGPEYIKSGTPIGIIPLVGQALARQACRRYVDNAANIDETATANYEKACRPYLDNIGYGTPPSLKKPFSGGQCPVAYNVTYQLRERTSRQTNCGVFGAATTENGIIPSSPRPIGPISGLSRVVIPGGGGINGSDNRERWNFTAANGPYSLSLGGAAQRSFWAACGPGYEVTGVNFTPVTGTQVCAPVPPVVVPPTPPGGPTINIEPIVIIPIVDIDAEVNVNIDGTVNIDIGTGDITIDPFGGNDGGGGVDGGDLVPDGGAAGTPVAAGAGGTAAGEAPPGKELVGVQVTVVQAPANFNQYANNAAVTYRGIGYVRMGYPGRLALDVGGSAVISPQFFLAPIRGLTAWEVRANLGFINTIVPYYRDLPS